MQKLKKAIKILAILLVSFIVVCVLAAFTISKIDYHNHEKNIVKYEHLETVKEIEKTKEETKQIENSLKPNKELVKNAISKQDETLVSRNTETIKESAQTPLEPLKSNEIREELFPLDSYDYSYIDKVEKKGEIYMPTIDARLNVFGGTNKSGEDLMLSGAIEQLQGQKMGLNNYILASHHIDYTDLLFSNIHLLEKGDYIYLNDLKHEYKYVVYDNQILTKKDLWTFSNVKINGQQEFANILTLYTCLPENANQENDRTVIRALLVDTKEL